jgi:aspartate racemase
VPENKVPTLLGILGGLGPMSGIYFCEMLTQHTYAQKDSDHLNFLLSSRADTPDRSSFILGLSSEDPTPRMRSEAKRLEAAGAELLVIPCNTAHYFYSKVAEAVDIPILNIIEETAKLCAIEKTKKVGVLATEGTISSGAYKDIFNSYGIEIAELTNDEQNFITETIFDRIKSGLKPDTERFIALCDKLFNNGCERIILGCTELSLIKKEHTLPNYVIDSLEVLCISALKICNKTPIGFDKGLMKLYNAEKGI